MGDTNQPISGLQETTRSEEIARSYIGSPISALSPSVGMGLAQGGLGAVCSQPGLGKTAMLVHLGLDVALRGGHVLHISLRDPVDRARAHWDELLREITPRLTPANNVALRIERARVIHSFAGRTSPPDGLDLAAIERSLDLLKDVAQFEPTLLLVDGLDQEGAAGAGEGLKALGHRWNLCTWMSVRSEPNAPHDPSKTGADVTVWFVPSGRRLQLEVSTGTSPPIRLPVSLDPASLLVFGDEVHNALSSGLGGQSTRRLEPKACTLYSGGAAGAEAAFGETAQRWGLSEVNLTFDGHLQARTHERYVLSPKELAMGDVSLTYVSRRLNRTYNDRGGLIRGVLQTLWHMVSRSQQIFVVGQIQEDGTVTGGTGWSVELARMWNRDLWVYDQDQVGWYRWDTTGWIPGTPTITSAHVCGTGTRYLNEDGRAAIEALFERSFKR